MQVLLVEDEPIVARSVGRLLKGNGFEVSHVETATAAFDAIQADDPDMVILDLGLPDQDGLDLLRALRRNGDATRVLVLSGRAPSVDGPLALRAGADDFLDKARAPAELCARVRAVLRRPACWASDDERTVRYFGEVEVNFASRSVRLGGQAVRLAPREYELLAALLGRAGEAVSREELLRDVWGYDHPVPTRTVDTHVARLRKKLEVDPADPRHLLTVPRVGYMLRTDPE